MALPDLKAASPPSPASPASPITEPVTELAVTVLATSAAAFGLALLSAVAGFGGGVLPLPVFTVLFGLRAAVSTQLPSNGSRAVVRIFFGPTFR